MKGKEEGVVGDEVQRVRVHDTPHPQASTFHGWDEGEEEKNMDTISINSKKFNVKRFMSFFFFFLLLLLWKVFLASLKGEKI